MSPTTPASAAGSAAPVASTTKKKRVVKEVVYPYPPEKVWVAITDPRALAEWLMPSTFQHAEVGHEFQFKYDPQRMCKSNTTNCVVLEVDLHRKMVWGWQFNWGGHDTGQTTVTFELIPEGSGTRLRFEPAGVENIPWMPRNMMRFGWGTMVKRWIPKVLANVGDDGSFTPGAIPLEKRCYKADTIPAEFVR